jgi:hypothetical protein
MGAVNVVFGPHDLEMDVAGLTVEEIQCSLGNVLNVNMEADAYLGGNLVEDKSIVVAAGRLEFMRRWGWKAAIDFPVETTPHAISPAIQRLCAELAPGQKPVFIRVEPSAEATQGNCVFNVPPHIEQFGGRMILGWCIWEWPGILLNAEFHACWLSPKEELIDITPKRDGENTILFLPDPLLRFDGKRILGRIEPLSYKREVLEYVAASRKEMQLKVQGGSVADVRTVLAEVAATRQKMIRRMGKKGHK